MREDSCCESATAHHRGCWSCGERHRRPLSSAAAACRRKKRMQLIYVTSSNQPVKLSQRRITRFIFFFFSQVKRRICYQFLQDAIQYCKDILTNYDKKNYNALVFYGLACAQTGQKDQARLLCDRDDYLSLDCCLFFFFSFFKTIVSNSLQM